MTRWLRTRTATRKRRPLTRCLTMRQRTTATPKRKAHRPPRMRKMNSQLLPGLAGPRSTPKLCRMTKMMLMSVSKLRRSQNRLSRNHHPGLILHPRFLLPSFAPLPSRSFLDCRWRPRLLRVWVSLRYSRELWTIARPGRPTGPRRNSCPVWTISPTRNSPPPQGSLKRTTKCLTASQPKALRRMVARRRHRASSYTTRSPRATVLTA